MSIKTYLCIMKEYLMLFLTGLELNEMYICYNKGFRQTFYRRDQVEIRRLHYSNIMCKLIRIEHYGQMNLGISNNIIRKQTYILEIVYETCPIKFSFLCVL